MSGPSIMELIEKHERYRSSGINLIASENYLSEEVRKALSSDLAGRYHTEWYGGSGYAQEILEHTESAARKLFGAKHALVSPISGNICDLAMLFTFTSPEDNIAMLPFTVGGYPLGVAKFHRNRISIPANEDSFKIDMDLTRAMMVREKIKLTILGSSFILFPQPVQEISDFIADTGHPSRLVYDGSHVLGLIGSGVFQDPLIEGAEVLFGSTHKSLYGPQGGMILTNSSDHAARLRNFLEIDIETGIGLVDNVHMNRVAALGIAMEEMIDDRDYGKRVVANARLLAASLDELGVPVRFKDQGFTRSHQILLEMDQENAVEFCNRLERTGIFIDIGGRLGVAEITHRGMERSEVEELADIIADVYHKGGGEEAKSRVHSLKKRAMI